MEAGSSAVGVYLDACQGCRQHLIDKPSNTTADEIIKDITTSYTTRFVRVLLQQRQR